MTVVKPPLYGIWASLWDGTASWVKDREGVVKIFYRQLDAEARLAELLDRKAMNGARINYEVREYIP